MKVRSNLKVGKDLEAYWADVAGTVRKTGKKMAPVAQKVGSTVTSRRFWLWPFDQG